MINLTMACGVGCQVGSTGAESIGWPGSGGLNHRPDNQEVFVVRLNKSRRETRIKTIGREALKWQLGGRFGRTGMQVPPDVKKNQ